MIDVTDQLSDAIAQAIKAVTGPLLARIAVLESRAAVPGPAGADGRPGVDGRDGRNGIDGKDGAHGLAGLNGADGLAGKDGSAGIDGKDGLNGKDGAPGLIGKDGSPGQDGRAGVDGINGKDGVAGIAGKDGRDGLDGRDGFNGKDGANGVNGKDGVDGLGFEDMDIAQRSPRSVSLKFARGDQQKSFDLIFPAMLYKGVYEASSSYEPGDVVTRQGSMWHCHAPTSELPGEGSKSWQLCVKRGAAGAKGEPGPKGITGLNGKDLTQMDDAGRKW